MTPRTVPPRSEMHTVPNVILESLREKEEEDHDDTSGGARRTNLTTFSKLVLAAHSSGTFAAEGLWKCIDSDQAQSLPPGLPPS